MIGGQDLGHLALRTLSSASYASTIAAIELLVYLCVREKYIIDIDDRLSLKAMSLCHAGCKWNGDAYHVS
jgi:hypothetical protein